MIKYATQDISKKDISEVVKTLKSDSWFQSDMMGERNQTSIGQKPQTNL